MAYEGTLVEVSKSQGDIRTMLRAAGATNIRFGEHDDDPREVVEPRHWEVLGFVLANLRIQMRAPSTEHTEDNVWERARKTHRKFDSVDADFDEQERRRIWRVFFWNIKSRLESIDEKVETVTQAFFSHIVDPEAGVTVYEGFAAALDRGMLEIGGPGFANASLALPAGTR